jgi:hypothetical protein
MRNVLYNPETNAVTRVDFKLIQACEADTMNPDEPEMFSIFGITFVTRVVRRQSRQSRLGVIASQWLPCSLVRWKLPAKFGASLFDALALLVGEGLARICCF